MIKNFLSIFFIALTVLSASCGASKTETTSNVAPHMNTNNPEKLAKTFVRAIVENDNSLLDEYALTAGIVGIMMTPGKVIENETMENEIIAPMKKRFEENMLNIQNAINENDIDRSKLKYKSFKYESDGSPSTPKPLIIFMDYKGEEIDVPVTVTEINGKWYLFEILISTGLFD
ncbi:MAG: hypothetical protein JXR19_10000 [Bacteroidia bacterium]